jgi:hypothetical protein
MVIFLFKVTGGWLKLHNVQFYDLNALFNIPYITVDQIKGDEMGGPRT